MEYLIMLGCFIAGLAVVFVIDHFFIFNKFFEPDGEFILEQINEDEAKVDLKIYDTVPTKEGKKVVLKVVRK